MDNNYLNRLKHNIGRRTENKQFKNAYANNGATYSKIMLTHKCYTHSTKTFTSLHFTSLHFTSLPITPFLNILSPT